MAKILTKATCNPAVIAAQYAVRGEIALRAEALRAKLEKGGEDAAKELGFSAIVNCNIGNPQQLGQKPLTYIRQVCSCIDIDCFIDRIPRFA